MSVYKVISPVLVRGPLLPVRALVLGRARAALLEHPLGPAALEVASRDLGAALTSGRRGRAPGVSLSLERYGRRAAFRATPTGLLGGVALAPLGGQTRLHSGAARATLRPAWGRLCALGRGLLDQGELRAQVKLRLCPSLLRGPDELVWLALEEDALALQSAALDPLLLALLLALEQGWVAWPQLRARLTAAGGPEDEDELDEWLLVLIDRGLVCHDLAPPLVGPPPLSWMRQRLLALRQGEGKGIEGDGAAYLAGVEEQLSAVLAAAGRLDAAGTRAGLQAMPGGGDQLHGGLGLEVKGAVARRAVERAAALAPLLFRLQEALAAPVAERRLDAGLLAQLNAAAEQFGAGAFDVEALAVGGYGAHLIDGEAFAPVVEDAPAGILGHLVEAVAAAARAGARQITLAAPDLDALLAPGGPPATFELCLGPTREPPRTAPGTGWLLGHHAPAGASFGRFAEVLGAPLVAVLAEIAAGEGRARPGEQALDVVHAASRALGDLSAHPPVRAAALALTGWPQGTARVLTPAQLALVVDDAAAESLALRWQSDPFAVPGSPVAPAAMHRVRSTTVPAGIYRLLAGWSFARQHAPWSFTWPGALSGLSFLPRVVLGGFVIAPASWALPDAETLRRPRALAGWRKQAPGLPRWVQVGQGDELLPVDLEAPGAGEDLARHAGGRAFEIWPPLDHLADAGGRRLEIIAAVVGGDDEAGEGQASRAIAATARAGAVPPPTLAPPAEGWLTLRLYGARAHQDAVLFDVVRGLVTDARAAGELAGWFFLRYLEPGVGGRDHLRVRLCATTPGKTTALRRRVQAALAPAREAGLLTAVEEADYFRETARYGGPQAMAAAEGLFQLSSELALQVLTSEHEDEGASEPGDDRHALLVRAQDALARGLGLNLGERRELAERRRAAFAHVLGDEPEEYKQEFRQRQRSLAARLANDLSGADVENGFAAYSAAVAQQRAALPTEVRATLDQALPALLHMQAGRLCGLDPEDERAAYVFWARTLEGLAARAKR